MAIKQLAALVFTSAIASLINADCRDANEKLRGTLDQFLDQMDEKCTSGKKVPVINLMPIAQKAERLIQNPPAALQGKLPHSMNDMVKKVMKVVKRSERLDYCDKRGKKSFMRRLQDTVMPYALGVKTAYDRFCNDYADFVESAEGLSFIQSIFDTITTAMS